MFLLMAFITFFFFAVIMLLLYFCSYHTTTPYCEVYLIVYSIFHLTIHIHTSESVGIRTDL